MIMPTRIRLMTYNVGGARRGGTSAISDVLEVVRLEAPDVAVVQETIVYKGADGCEYDLAAQLAEAAGFGSNYFFGPVVSLRKHLHIAKRAFVEALFSDLQEWEHGNAIFSRSGFSRLGDPEKAGVPWNVPLFMPPVYEGNRDTESRYALLSRICMPPVNPFVVGVHLTTLVGERQVVNNASAAHPEIVERAQNMRYQQTRRICRLLERHVLERGNVAFLLGDFNAVASESAIASVIEKECGFQRLVPENSSPTHLGVGKIIDHIFAYPAERIVSVACRVVDTPLARRASDHLPIVADVVIS